MIELSNKNGILSQDYTNNPFTTCFKTFIKLNEVSDGPKPLSEIANTRDH